MATNKVYKDADYISLPVPTGKKSGEPVRVGGLNAVLQTNEGSLDKGTNTYDTAASSNEPGFASVALKGAFMLPISGTTVLAVGSPVYLQPSGVLSTTDASGANTLFGHILTPKSAVNGARVVVRITN